MKIIIAPDSFKESLSAAEVAAALAKGIQQVLPDAECVCVPLADGGEGTVDALVAATGGEWISCQVQDPLGRKVEARYGLLHQGRCAVIEMAEASGLQRVAPDERNPLLTSTYGTGQLIADALDRGVTELLLGLGGSATNDAGIGMLQALGGVFLDVEGQILPPGGAALVNLQQVDLTGLHPGLKTCRIEVACDVDNPLCGPRGASVIFGPQKGANPEQVAQLDQALASAAARLVALGWPDHRQTAGAGAAGGMGFAALSGLNASLKPGIELVMATTGLEARLQDADLIITGEGRLDEQTLSGKTPLGVLRLAQRHGIPVVAVAGSVAQDLEPLYQAGFTAIWPILPAPMDLPTALQQGQGNLMRTGRSLAALWRAATRS